MVGILFLLIQMTFYVGAVEYGMSKNILIDAAQPHSFGHCESLDSTPKGGNGFLAQIECSYQCENGQEVTINVDKPFIPEDLQMRRGDGNYWASLGTSLSSFSGEICLQKAQIACLGLEKIKSLGHPKIKSGNWKLDQKLECSKEAPLILSPFSKTLKLDPILKTSSIAHSDPALEIPTMWKQKIHFGFKPRLKPLPSTCKKKIWGTICFGDCITIDKKSSSKELLSSPQPLGSDQHQFCADELMDKFKGKKLSSDVIEFYCRDFFLGKLKLTKARGLTCASSRFNLDCSQLKN